MGESAGHVFAEHGVGEEAAGHDDEWPARGAARGLKHQQDKPRPVEQVQIGDVFHILEAAGDVVRLLENIHVDGDGQCNQRQIDENGEPAFLFPRSQLARRDEEQDEDHDEGEVGSAQDVRVRHPEAAREIDLEQRQDDGDHGGHRLKQGTIEGERHAVFLLALLGGEGRKVPGRESWGGERKPLLQKGFLSPPPAPTSLLPKTFDWWEGELEGVRSGGRLEKESFTPSKQ